MTTKKKFQLRGKTQDTYLALVKNFPLVSIQSDEHLRQSRQVMDDLLKCRLDAGQEAYLAALTDLVEKYEDDHHAIAPATDADMPRHLLDSKGITQSRLSKDTGLAKSSISDLLAGRRTFTKKMISVLAPYFQIDPGILTANF